MNNPKRSLQKEVLEFIRDNPDLRHTSYTIGLELNCSNNNAARALSRLQLFKRITWDKGHHGDGAKLIYYEGPISPTGPIRT